MSGRKLSFEYISYPLLYPKEREVDKIYNDLLMELINKIKGQRTIESYYNNNIKTINPISEINNGEIFQVVNMINLKIE